MIESGKKKFASRCRLFVGNLSNDVKESDLREIFEKYGDVVECFMSGKGFGFVRLVGFPGIMLTVDIKSNLSKIGHSSIRYGTTS